MRPFLWSLGVSAVVAAAYMLYWAPTNVVKRARKRGTYVPPQIFEMKRVRGARK